MTEEHTAETIEQKEKGDEIQEAPDAELENGEANALQSSPAKNTLRKPKRSGLKNTVCAYFLVSFYRFLCLNSH